MYNHVFKRIIQKCFRYISQKPRIFKYWLLSEREVIEGIPQILQPVLFVGKGKILIGDKVKFGVKESPFFYSGYSYLEARRKNSIIKIGNNFWANNNLVMISMGDGIFIGSNILIGTNVEIYDSDFHSIDSAKRNNGSPKTKNVSIEDNVFIGSNVKILKGTKIGKNSVIANGSIVTKSIPENVVAGGVPCKVIKKMN